MEWTGINDVETDVADAGKTTDNFLENGSLRVAGECGRRPGLGARIANTGIVCAELGAYVVFVKSNGNIESELQ